MQNDIYAEIVRLSAAGQEAALATLILSVGSTPREEGAKMLVKPDGSIMGTIGGGAIEKAAIKDALEVIRAGKARKIEYRLSKGGELGMLCGGDAEVFIEPIGGAPSLFVFGAGHIAVPLAKMAAIVGYKISVIDERPDFATAARFPDAAEVVVSEIIPAYARLNIEKGSYIVIVTHGHKGDETALEGALKTPAKYIGMIGSADKVREIFRRLKDKKLYPLKDPRVHSPIGLNLGGKTPGEIAVSVLAEIIKTHYKRDGAHMRVTDDKK